MEFPPLGDKIPKFQNQFSQITAKLILKLTGWRMVGTLPDLPKFILIGAPHTSNWDAFYGFAGLASIGLKVKWMAKHTLFPKPIRGLLTTLGGVPIDRRASQGTVDQTINAVNESEQIVLIITPEGTRTYVEKWKTGFYHIAIACKIPIQTGFVDYPKKSMGFGPLIEPSGDMNADLKKIETFYMEKQGKHPHFYNPKVF